MRSFFFPKLAFANLRRNARLTLPYILTNIITVAMFYIMCFMGDHKGLEQMPDSSSVILMLRFGIIICGLFSAIFLFYTSSFLIKRRKLELGLYSVLGMEKRHIARMLLCESAISSFVSLVLGIGGGMLFSKLAIALLCKLCGFAVPFNFYVSTSALLTCVCLFVPVYLITLLYNMWMVKKTNAIDLLKGGNTGEKEPKTKWIMAVLGLLCTGYGYYIAITVESPLSALALFFLAVFLVVVGTYFLFIAGSVALLKLLRKNKKLYYKTKNFTNISGMIYRMKQNAVGLANICILSTMVLVILSTTVSLYIGVDEIMIDRYPKDITVTIYETPKDSVDHRPEIERLIGEEAKKLGLKITDNETSRSVTYVTVNMGDNSFGWEESMLNELTDEHYARIRTISDVEYEKITGISLPLEDGEIAVYDDFDELNGDSVTIYGRHYDIVKRLDVPPPLKTNVVFLSGYYIIVVNENEFAALRGASVDEAGYDSTVNCIISFNASGSAEEEVALTDNIGRLASEYFREEGINEDYYASVDSREKNWQGFLNTFGGFLFIGIFLGSLFIVAAVLIIYYKQISEGYEDRERFEIMQKVGMSRQEVRKTILSQIVFVFFLPLMVAVVHVAAAFPLLTKLLTLFGLENVPLYLICTLCTVLVFAAAYAIVYALTAKTYYKIVVR